MTQAITIIVDGEEIDTFTDASVTKSIETLCGSFIFGATNEARSRLVNWKLKVGKSCQIKVQGEPVINGYIEKMRIKYSMGTHIVQVVGRDRTADLVDDTFGQTSFSGKLTLKQLIEQILTRYNLSAIKVIDPVETEPFDPDDFLAISFGSSIFKFMEKYAMKRQVLLTTDGNGDIVFIRLKEGEKSRPALKTQLSIDKNTPGTILEADINYDWSKRFNQYSCNSQALPLDIASMTQNPKIAARLKADQQSGIIIDKKIRDSRIYYFDADSADKDESLTKRALWEANFRRVQSETWTYTVQGHMAKDDNVIWKPAFDVKVSDKYGNIHDEFLISSVNYTESSSEGTKTVLKLMDKSAFSLLVNKPIGDEEINPINQYLTSPLEETRERVRRAREAAEKQQ